MNIFCFWYPLKCEGFCSFNQHFPHIFVYFKHKRDANDHSNLQKIKAQSNTGKLIHFLHPNPADSYPQYERFTNFIHIIEKWFRIRSLSDLKPVRIFMHGDADHS